MKDGEVMSEQAGNVEQCDAAVLPNPKKEIHIRIDFGKRFCIIVVILAALVAGVFVAARFLPRDTSVGVYRARQFACLHDDANAMFVVTADYTCFFILYDEVGGPANAGGADVLKGTWKQEGDGSIAFTLDPEDGRPPTIIIGRSYWGGLKMKPGEPDPWWDYEYFLLRMLSGFL